MRPDRIIVGEVRGEEVTDIAYSSAEHLSEYVKSYSNKLRASRKDSPASKAEALKKKELRSGTESVESAPKYANGR